jgi:hypothetical protein
MNLVSLVVVPILILPLWLMKKSGRVDDPTANSGTPARRFEVSTESLAHGVVEPTPTFVFCATKSVEVPETVVPLAL